MKEKILGYLGGAGLILIWLFAFIAFFLPIDVILSHFGAGFIISFIVTMLYYYFGSTIPLLNEALMIIGGYFAYKEWPTSFFIFYCIIFGIYTIYAILLLLPSSK